MFFAIIFAFLFYTATAILVVGVVRKIAIYARTPAPLKIAVTPAPVTLVGVVWRMTKEITIFQSLYKSNKWIWIFGWLFHITLLLVMMRHLRYFTEPVWWWVELIQPFGKYAGFALLAALFGLWARRFLVDRVRYITSLSDHLILLLIIAIGASGLAIKYLAHTDIVALKAYMLGLIYFDIQPLPADPLLLMHLTLVITLMVIFPISKLLHAPGIFFCPTRTQVDNPRERRHTAGWTAQ